MDYKLKYLKYKEKYLSLKGGAIQYDNIKLNHILSTILNIDQKLNFTVKATKDTFLENVDYISYLNSSSPTYENDNYMYELIKYKISNFNLFLSQNYSSQPIDNVLKIIQRDTKNYIEIYKNMDMEFYLMYLEFKKVYDEKIQLS